MVKSRAIYQGQKHCELIHEPSGSKLETDAPKDNQGKGERFSPTDLVGAALTSCTLTTMAIVGERDGLKLEGMHAEVEKIMSSNPRRIESLNLKITMPEHLSADQREKMENTAKNCPVALSLSGEMNIPMTFIYE